MEFTYIAMMYTIEVAAPEGYEPVNLARQIAYEDDRGD